MQPELASSAPLGAGAPPADVVPLRSSSRAHTEELETPPPHQDRGDGVDGDADGASTSELEDPRPASDSEIIQAVLALPGAHRRSPDEVRRIACQLPRSVFVAALEEVQAAVEDASSRRPIGLLIYRLRVELEGRTQQAMAAIAGDASARFGYGVEAPSDALRRDPERWVEAMAPVLSATDVDRYLRSYVADELLRARLRARADELRAKA